MKNKLTALIFLTFLIKLNSQELLIYKNTKYDNKEYFLNFSKNKDSLFLLELHSFTFNKNEIVEKKITDSTIKIKSTEFIVNGKIISDSLFSDQNFLLKNKNSFFYNAKYSHIEDSTITLYLVKKTSIDTFYIENDKIYYKYHNLNLYLCEYNKKHYKIDKNTIETVKYLDCKELYEIKPDICFEYIYGWQIWLSMRFNFFAFKNSMLVAIKVEGEPWYILQKRVPLWSYWIDSNFIEVYWSYPSLEINNCTFFTVPNVVFTGHHNWIKLKCTNTIINKVLLKFDRNKNRLNGIELYSISSNNEKYFSQFGNRLK